MSNPKSFEETISGFANNFSTKISELVAGSPAKDLEKNAKALATSLLGRLDLVTREEFDVQQEVLQRSREKIAAMEARITALEEKSQNP